MKKINFSFQSLMNNNRALHIISVVIGILLWCYVVTFIYPDTEAEFKVTVDLSGQQEQIDELGLNIIGESSQEVTVKVRGQRYLIATIDPEDDLHVTASLDKVDGPGSYALGISGETEGLEYLSISPSTLNAAGRINLIDINDTSITPSAGLLGNIDLCSSRAFVCSIEITRGSPASFPSSCPVPTSIA